MITACGLSLSRSQFCLQGFAPGSPVSSPAKNLLMSIGPQDTLRLTGPIVIAVCITEMVIPSKYVTIILCG